MLLIQPVALLRKIYPRATWHLSRRDKTIYLTFDDGPFPETTREVLKLLERYKARLSEVAVSLTAL